MCMYVSGIDKNEKKKNCPSKRKEWRQCRQRMIDKLGGTRQLHFDDEDDDEDDDDYVDEDED